MKRTIYLALVIVAAALGAVALYRKDVTSDLGTRSISGAAADRSSGVTATGRGARLDAPTLALPPQDSRKPLDRVGGISQLVAKSNQAGEASGQDLQQLMDAAAYCAYYEVAASFTKRKLSTQQEMVRKYAQDFANTFCNVAVPGPGELEARMLNLDSQDEVLQANILMNLEGQEALSAGVPAAERMLRSAKSPAALARAADFLLLYDQDIPQVATRPFPPSIDTRQELIDAQRLALAMVGCNIRGGCGPGGLYTALQCIDQCRSGVSLAQVWAGQYSPETIQYARDLAAAIENDPGRKK